SEADLGSAGELPVSISTVDQGLMPDATIAAKHPVPKPSAVGSPTDFRRARAALVSVLRRAGGNGDALLSAAEAIEGVNKLPLASPCELSNDWFRAHRENLAGVLEILDVRRRPGAEQQFAAVQLTEVKMREERLQKILRQRCAKAVEPVKEPWADLVIDAIERTGHVDFSTA